MKNEHKHKPSKRPVGQATRGKTAQNRLRRVDTWLMLHEPALLRRAYDEFAQAWFVDLGFGVEPFTTLESAARLRRISPNLPILGVEIDPPRVQTAQPYSDERTQFRLGGFNLPLEPGEAVRAVRAFNVLRQYEESQVHEAHALLMSQILPGGILVEGTSDPYGRVWAANVLRSGKQIDNTADCQYEGLLFSTNFHSGFDPTDFQPVLPKNFIHHMSPGEKLYHFMENWKYCARETISLRSMGLRQWFIASAKALKMRGFHVEIRSQYLRKGFLLWDWEKD